jgi:hypothetical protein
VLLIGNMRTPSYVRRLIAAHPWPNEDLITAADVPVLFSYGALDKATDTEAIPGHAVRFSAARVRCIAA